MGAGDMALAWHGQDPGFDTQHNNNNNNNIKICIGRRLFEL